jgi:DNA-binding response OmpR family regulator
LDTTATVKRPHSEAYVGELEERIVQLTKALGATLYAPPALRLTQSEATIVNMLLARPLLTREAAWTVLYGADPNGPDPKIFDVFLAKIRPKLRLHDVEISTVWGRGWFLDHDSRARLQSIYDAPAPWSAE